MIGHVNGIIAGHIIEIHKKIEQIGQMVNNIIPIINENGIIIEK
jgi:hypothetical protein